MRLTCAYQSNSLRNIETAWKRVDAELKHLVASRREEMASAKERAESEKKDVFRLMLRASDGQGTLSMSDEELVRMHVGII